MKNVIFYSENYSLEMSKLLCQKILWKGTKRERKCGKGPVNEFGVCARHKCRDCGRASYRNKLCAYCWGKSTQTCIKILWKGTKKEKRCVSTQVNHHGLCQTHSCHKKINGVLCGKKIYRHGNCYYHWRKNKRYIHEKK